MEIVHLVHLVGEYNEVIGVFANTLFAVSLLHGGHHYIMVHVRRWRIAKRKGHPVNKAEEIRELI
jgi:hypothetical protein